VGSTLLDKYTPVCTTLHVVAWLGSELLPKEETIDEARVCAQQLHRQTALENCGFQFQLTPLYMHFI